MTPEMEAKIEAGEPVDWYEFTAAMNRGDLYPHDFRPRENGLSYVCECGATVETIETNTDELQAELGPEYAGGDR